jgi:nitroreductase
MDRAPPGKIGATDERTDVTSELSPTTGTTSSDPASRLAARYGTPADFTPPTWNPVLDLLLRHHSVRQWLPGEIDEPTLRTVIAAAQSAPSSSNKQVVSVIAVRDPESRRRLAAVGRQMSSHIVDAPVTLVWLIDYSHGRFLASRARGTVDATSGADAGSQGHGVAGTPDTDLGALDYLDEAMAAAADIGIAAQNAAVAAESLGLGTVFLGSIRNDLDEVRAILDVPETVVPFLGLELGHPDPEENAGVKPRLPMDLFLHHDSYARTGDDGGDRDARRADLLTGYDATLASYYSRYGSHPRWSAQLLNRLGRRAVERTDRRFLRRIMERAGFGLH